MKRLIVIVFLCGVVNFLTSCSMPGQTYEKFRQTYGKLWPRFGDTYVGQLLFGNMHGHGIYTFSSGEKYVGTFTNDLMNGRGTFTWSNGDAYVGGH